MKTTEVQFLQNDGYDATLAAVKVQFESEHPKRSVASMKFLAAYPGDRDGRWVTIEVTYEDK